jgi:cytoskeletal protein CcmA (bactofilin family)
MSCLSAVTLSMYADRELASSEAREVAAHLQACEQCRVRAAALAAETAHLRKVLATAAASAPVRRLERPLGTVHIVVAAAAAVAMTWVANVAWDGIHAVVPVGLEWLNPFGLRGLVDLIINFVVYLSFEDKSMLSSIVEIAASVALIVTAACGAMAAYKPRAGTAAILAVALVVLAVPSLGHALEIRRADITTVAANETVDDTLIAIGDSVSIEGNVNGDLIAFARRLSMRGHVTGDVIGAAETVSIEGPVDGNVFGFGRGVTLGATTVGRNLYGFGRDVTIDRGADIAANATTFANDVDVSGRVGRDLVSLGNEFALSGRVERNVEVYGNEVTIVPPGSVGGDVTAHIPTADKLTGANGTTVSGQVHTEVGKAPGERRNRYASVSFYIRQAIRLGAAFLAGALLLWIFPGLRTLSIGSGPEGLKAGGLGLVTLVMLPVLALIACLTIFGIPIGILGFVLWLLGLYFAKIVVAQMIGRSLFKSPMGYPHYAATLVAGLVIVIIAINLPWIGALTNLVLTCVGLGLLALYAAGVHTSAAAY